MSLQNMSEEDRILVEASNDNPYRIAIIERELDKAPTRLYVNKFLGVHKG